MRGAVVLGSTVLLLLAIGYAVAMRTLAVLMTALIVVVQQ